MKHRIEINCFVEQEDRDLKTIDERLLELHIEESQKEGQVSSCPPPAEIS